MFGNLYTKFTIGLRKRIEKYKCGNIHTALKEYICGYFKTSEHSPVEEGTPLAYLGIVKEKRYLVKINNLKWTRDDLETFLRDTGLLEE